MEKAAMINEMLTCMATSEENAAIQRVQTEHRLKLATYWGIKQGDRILEIGCGQGDTTAVLAYLVGDTGFVHGIDIASPDYGAPITLGDSIAYLKESAVGKQIKVDFETDILDSNFDFPVNHFDYIVLSHCSWYLRSHEELASLFVKLKRWGKKLCFAEWDTNVTEADQIPHFLAVLIQAQYECFKSSSLANVRTLFTPMDVKNIANHAGWRQIQETSIYSPQLQDGEWEIDLVLTDFQDELQLVEGMPDKMHLLLESQLKLLEKAAQSKRVKPMHVFTFVAESTND